MNTNSSHVPPGFRFHPTDEELVDYYLRRKINSRPIDLDVIKDVDLYKIEPWDLQELCRLGTEEQNEWYFFSHKDKKYPTGSRTNRATTAGFWKATGRDKAIYSKHDLIGMRKTLVFYKGRAPNGHKSDWIMHEYRLETHENGAPQEEGWVVCRVFKKRVATTMRRVSEHESPCWYDDHMPFMPAADLDSPPQVHNNFPLHQQSYNINYTNYHRGSCANNNYNDKELVLPFQIPQENLPFIIPSCNSSTAAGTTINTAGSNAQLPSSCSTLQLKQDGQTCAGGAGSSHNNVNQNLQLMQSMYTGNNNKNSSNNNNDGDAADMEAAVATDWRAMDKFVASQLSQEDHLSRIVTRVGNQGNVLGHEDENATPKPSDPFGQRASAISSAAGAAAAYQVDIWK